MALEPITRQEKIIAGQDLTPITRMEKFLKQYGGGSGGVTSWNELEGKPFVTVGGDTLEWDGNTEGKSSTMDGTAYHVSDVVLTIADFANGATGYLADMEFTIDATSIVDVSGDGGAFLVPLGDVPGIAVCSEKYVGTDFGDGLMCDKAGIYLFYADANSYISSLTIPGYTGFTKEQIDPAVLPDALQFGDKMTEIMPETEVTGVDNGGNYLVFFESFPEADECHVTFDGVKYTCKKISLDGDIAYGNLSILGAGDDTGEPFVLCMGAAIVKDDAPHTIGISEMWATPIDEKYLPPRKTFYVKYNDASDIYLYTDEAKTTKATMEDVKAADEMHGIRIETGLGMWATPLIVKTGVSSGNGAHDYAMVGVVKALNGDTATFAFYYTDKYTAS